MYCCPVCHGELETVDQSYKCKNSSCGNIYPLVSGKPIFLETIADKELNNEQADWLDQIKYFFKSMPVIYDFLTVLFAPVYYRQALKRKLINLVKENSGLVINIGSGNLVLDKSFLNFDCYPYENVDVVGDAAKLPFKNQSVSGIINISVLEHTEYSSHVIKEASRVLHKGGVLCTAVPFIQGYHASPNDYQRWTLEGLENLHRGFSVIESGISVGPTSGFLWVVQEWLAMLLSFGIKPLYKMLYIILLITTWPIKYLDIFLANHPLAKNIAGGFYIVAVKK